MVICKYFLRGSCRFGENCKNEHTYNDNSGSVMRKKQDIDPNVIIKSVSNDMDKAENGHQWPFSCYGPFQGKPCFPGFEDKSFEEVRYGFIESEKNGTVEQYKQQLMQLINEIRMKTRSLLNPTPEASKMLQELFNCNTENQNVFTNNSTNLFTNNPSNQPSIFANNQSIFPNQPVATNSPNNFTFTLPENKNIFANQMTSGSIFNQSNQTGFLPNNMFANAQPNFASNTNIFQNPSNQNFSNTGNIFAPPNQIFPQQSTGGNIFAQNNLTEANPFKQNSPFAQNNIPDQHNPFQQTIDPFKQNPNTVDPFKQSTNPVDPFKQNMNPVDPFKQNTNPVDSFKLNTNPVDPFKQNTNTVDPFQQNIFQQTPPPTTNQSPFAQANTFVPQNSVLNAQEQNNVAEHTKSIFGPIQTNIGYQTQLDTRRKDDTTIYSKIEDLTDKEIKQFEGAAFEFGNIPVNPPTLQMC